jgi:hypothetical protein
MKEEKENLEEIKKEIAIERLRQAPPSIKVSFGTADGKFMNRDEMIKQIQSDTEIGKKIMKMQLEYLKAFKKEILAGD